MIEVRAARDDAEARAALAVRRAVFVQEQGVPLDEDVDGRDAEALHLVAVDTRSPSATGTGDGAVLATCRLLFSGETVKLERMATLAAARGRGLASRLLAEAEAQARARGAHRIVLGAQLAAMTLYARAGYLACGDVFLDAGIEHVMMEKRLRGNA